jgi:hypothetical protein
VFNDPPVYPDRIDPGDRFRDRRRRTRRRRAQRRIAVAVCLIGGVVALALNARFISGGDPPAASPPTAADPAQEPTLAVPQIPDEIRGLHVTAPLASIPGKLDEYIAMASSGLNTIQLDVKDENGEIGFRSSELELARKIGAAQAYYRPREVARKVHDAGLYLIGRIVVFQDPRLASARPDMAIQTPAGDIWATKQGLGWTNPYDPVVWDYVLNVAVEAAKAGFDEIMFDYVRFPTDGPAGVRPVYPGEDGRSKAQVIADFLAEARERLAPYDVQLSAALFGLAATEDLGIGQRPELLGKHLDAVYPMVYPSHFGPGQYEIEDPFASPGLVVSNALVDFRAALEERVRIVPWLQDWNYAPDEVAEQVAAARRAHTGGYLLWNSDGVYTPGSLVE